MMNQKQCQVSFAAYKSRKSVAHLKLETTTMFSLILNALNWI